MPVTPVRHCLLSVVVASLVALPSLAGSPFNGSGTMTVDDSTSQLAFESSTVRPKPYGGLEKELFVLVSDRALGDTAPDDDVEVAQRAKAGDLAVLTLCLDGTRLVNVAFSHSRLHGTIVLPGSWFGFRSATTASGAMSGSLRLARRQWDGHAYACAVDFVTPAPMPAPESAAPTPGAPTPGSVTGKPAKPDPEYMTKLLLQAMMQKDEARAIQLIGLGADPNARDKWGVPVLNRAVMLCLPQVVQALVDAKADVNRVRSPGVTILQEAWECPEADKILRAAGAH